MTAEPGAPRREEVGGADRLAGDDLREVRRGLRMSRPLDEAALRREAEQLDALARLPFFARARGYLRQLGPGYLQSAMTLGAGSASSALFAGAMFGYDLLWVAPLGMLLGVLMLSAIAHQTLSTGARALPAMAAHAGRPLAYGFAFAAVLASVVWHFPQYNLAAGSLVDLATAAGAPGLPPMAASAAVLVAAVVLALLYGKGSTFARRFERILKWLVWGIVGCLAWVVLATGTDFGAMLSGFVPQVPAPQNGVDPSELIASGLAAAVGVNMVLLYPYSLLARGWGRSHRALARWDLGVGMLLPYALATSLMTIAAANTLHSAATPVERTAAITEAARVLGSVLGPLAGRLVFDCGMLAMALSTITLHMVVCGFVGMELFGVAYGSRAHRLFSLLPVPGVLAPLFWSDMAVWLAVPTNIVCGLMLPLAYLGFLILQRSRAYLGKDRPTGPLARLWFAAMALATLFLLAFLVWAAWHTLPQYLDRLFRAN